MYMFLPVLHKKMCLSMLWREQVVFRGKKAQGILFCVRFELFERYDANASGYLTIEEFKNMQVLAK